MKIETIAKSELNIVNEGTVLQGELQFSGHTRIQGTLKGDITCDTDSLFIVADQGMIEGTFKGGTLIISGYFRGKAFAEKEIRIEGNSRVFGELEAPKIEILTGAHFEGKTQMLKFFPELKASL